MRLVRKWGPAILICCFLFWSSSRSDMKVSQDVGTDRSVRKAVHFVVYGLLSASFYRATGNFILSVVMSTLYGVFDEFHQTYTPFRSGKISDVFIDFLGAASAAFLIWRFYPILPKRLKNWLTLWSKS